MRYTRGALELGTMTAPRAPFFPADRSIRADEALEIQRLGTVDYQQAWDLQAKLARQRADDEIPDQLLFLEHPDVYTAGKRTQPSDLPTNGLPTIKVDRGGRITWHGRGQLVVYPIIKLAEPVDVVDYVRRLEEAIIDALNRFGTAKVGRIEGRSGVWVPRSLQAVDKQASKRDRKIAALGIRVTRGVTMHGLSLNCNNTLDFYEHIVACGIDDADVTTLSLEHGRDVTTEEMIPLLQESLQRALAGELAVSDHDLDASQLGPSPQ